MLSEMNENLYIQFQYLCFESVYKDKFKGQTKMHRIIRSSISSSVFHTANRFCYYKPKSELQLQSSQLKSSMLYNKSFPEIISILKNPSNPYPKNSAYFYTMLQCILDESNQNSKIMQDYGETIHVFLQEIMDRIKGMGAKELSEILALNKYRPKALRFDKELLITMHVRFEGRINELIDLNEKNLTKLSPEQKLTIEDVKNQIQGLFYLKKNTNILSKVLRFSYNMVLEKKRDPLMKDSPQQIAKDEQTFYSMIETINENLDDTIDPVRQSIAQFIQQNYRNRTLPYHREILRMMVKCKFYKNYPIVRNEDWMHEYVYGYLKRIVKGEVSSDVEEVVSVLKSVITYAMHIEPQSNEGFVQLIDEGYQLAKTSLLSISYMNDKQQLSRQVNTISHQIKLIPSYLYLKNYLKINTTEVNDGNKVDNKFIKSVIDQIRVIIKKFVLCYFEKVEGVEKDGRESLWLASSIDHNIEVLNNIIKNQQEPEKLLLKSVQNLLNTVTVFKDYNIINIDVEFSLLLIETEIIYCILCRQWISDQVRYLRLLQHSVFVICEFEREVKQGNTKIIAFNDRIQRIKGKLREELAVYDNMDKTYKQFTVLRLVAILQCMNIKPKYLGDFYRNVKLKKPNIYVETLSRTMLKNYNSPEVIDAFELMFQNKLPVKDIELGRIVFLSSKQPALLKYWIHTNRKFFVQKICFCRRVINNIVSIIRMDNLQINRNSIQLLAEIVIENKLQEIDSQSASHQQETIQLKKILCNNFSILFRYSKMDSMIDDIFVVHKNVPTIFRNRFSHIQLIKILSFSSYLSEQQSIFYINRQNKNALFKYVIMLMKKAPYCQRQKSHYLLGSAYNQQDITLSIVNRIIEQYWPDNKLTNKGMPFYCEFLGYFTQVNKFWNLVKNENTIFLIIKEILQDFKLVQNNAPLKHLVSRIEHNYQRLHFLSIFENQNNINNTLQNVISSMNFVMDMKIFGEFVKVCEGWIREEIEVERKRRSQGGLVEFKEWKRHDVDKHLVNLMVVEKMQSLEEVADYQILGLMTVDVLAHGVRQVVNQNMQLLMRRLLKINPLSARLQCSQTSQKKRFPFQMFKLVMSNMNMYLENRQKRQIQGKQAIVQELSNEKVCDWMIKCLLTYAREIQNNQELDFIVKYLHSWGVDVLALVRSKFLDPKINLKSLCVSYFSVEVLATLWGQNVVRFNVENPHQSLLSNQNIVNYIKVLVKELQQTHLMNNYGVYFQQDGELILNVIKALLMGVLNYDSGNAQLVKEAGQCLKQVRALCEEFSKISSKTFKYNRMRSGKHLHLQGEQNGQEEDIVQKRHRKPSQQLYDVSSKTLHHMSNFSEILEVMTLIKSQKSSLKTISPEHSQTIKKISTSISKRQKALLMDSQLTYFIDNEALLEEKVFPQLGLRLYMKKGLSSNGKRTAFYLVNEKESMLYDFSYKKRRRLCGEEQLVVDYIEGVANLQGQGEKGVSEIEIKVLPNSLSKTEFKKVLSN